MFKKIMVPVDLRHAEAMEKAMAVAASLARLYGSSAYVVGVTQSSPTEVAKTPEEYAVKLQAFADEHAKSLGVTFEAHAETSHDPTIDLDDVLEQASDAIGADLIVMASHVPGFAEHIFASNAGYLASHSHTSVFVVR